MTLKHVPVGRAIGRGGAMDGADLGDASADEYEVEMADRSRHRYVRSSDEATAGGGGEVCFYDWDGRV